MDAGWKGVGMKLAELPTALEALYDEGEGIYDYEMY